MPSPALPAARDEVAFTDQLADGDLRTLERRAVLVDVVLGTLDPANGFRKCRVVPDVVTAHELVEHIDVTPRLLERTANDVLVLSRHRTPFVRPRPADSTPRPNGAGGELVGAAHRGPWKDESRTKTSCPKRE